MRGWVASGGRLVIVGGTGGPRTLTAIPDELLPYRPTATTDAPAAALAGLLGDIPASATDLPALSGALTDGRALATVGDRVIAAERAYGTGQPHPPRLRRGRRLDRRIRRCGRAVAPPPAAAHVGAARLLRRQHAGQRRVADAVARAAAGRRTGHPAGCLHPAHRSDQLPGAPSPRPAGMGLVHDARAGGRISRRRLRVRGAAEGQRGHRQRGGDRLGRARGHGGLGPDLRRHLLAVAGQLPAAGPGWCAPVGPDQRLHERPGGDDPARRPAGRSGADPQPRRRFRFAADDPGGDRGRGPADRDRPAPRGRAAQGHGP